MKPVLKEIFRANADETVDIWELASQVDKDIPEDIWEVVCKCLQLMWMLNTTTLSITNPHLLAEQQDLVREFVSYYIYHQNCHEFS